MWRWLTLEGRTYLLIFLSAIVMVSGCVDNQENNIDELDTEGKGLEIESLTVSDNTLNPGQRAELSLTLKNYHTKDIEIEELTVINDGMLKVGETSQGEQKQGECSPPDIEPARQGIAPEMTCTWTLEAPEDENLGAFPSKPLPVTVRIAYQSNLENPEPLKVRFDSFENIESTEKVTKEFSNGEVEAVMSTENPISFQGDVIDFEVRNSGPGSVESDYSIDYRPKSAFSDCIEKKSEVEPVIGSEAKFSCQINPETETPTVRNLFTSISYKYVKAPNVDIEVVKR